jgi:hypothetical protein
MRTIIAAAFLTAITASAAWAQTPAPACGLKQMGSLAMVGPDDDIRLPMMVNDKPKVFALRLDNGLSGVSSDIVDEFNLGATSLDPNFHVGHEGVTIRNTVNVKLQLGPIGGKNVMMLEVPAKAYGEGISGDIGTGMLTQVDFDIDMAGRKFGMFLPDHCPGKVVYWTGSPAAQVPFDWDKDGKIVATMELDGKPVKVSIGTEKISVMGMNTVYNLFGVDEKSPSMVEVPDPQSIIPSLPKDRKIYAYTFKSLAAGGLSVANPKILVYGEPVSKGKCGSNAKIFDVQPYDMHPTIHTTALIACYGVVDVRLGLSVLSKLHLYFSTKEKLIYATAAGAH